MHHSDEPLDPEHARKLREMFDPESAKVAAQKLAGLESLGATGEFPEGKLVEHDEGEIKFAVGPHYDAEGRAKIAMEFGRSVRWVAMNPQQALDLADLLKKQAAAILRGK